MAELLASEIKHNQQIESGDLRHFPVLENSQAWSDADFKSLEKA